MAQRIYTGTGDRGETGLFGGGRVPKSHPRVEAYGAIDELNAMLGWVRTIIVEPQLAGRLESVQPDLFVIGAHLATEPREGRRTPDLPALPQERIATLESWIDDAERELPELRTFIMPGGSAGGAALHLARTVCRRAERRVVDLGGEGDAAELILVYLNRLSDLLFVWARRENAEAGVSERPWSPRA